MSDPTYVITTLGAYDDEAQVVKATMQTEHVATSDPGVYQGISGFWVVWSERDFAREAGDRLIRQPVTVLHVDGIAEVTVDITVDLPDWMSR